MLDDARRAEHAARESLTAAAAQRAAVEKGPRAQEIAAADAAAEAAAASLAALDYQIHRGAVLTAPSAGIIRARLAEPGDMASPSRTIYQLSVADPKWIRAYLTERQLGLVKEGTLAAVLPIRLVPLTAPSPLSLIQPNSRRKRCRPRTCAPVSSMKCASPYEIRRTGFGSGSP